MQMPRRPQLIRLLTRLLEARCEVCPVCATLCPRPLLSCPQVDHEFCKGCLLRWISQPEQLTQLVADVRNGNVSASMLQVHCLHGCGRWLSPRILNETLGTCPCSTRATCRCGPAVSLFRDLLRRGELLRRTPPTVMAINCESGNCVGVGYITNSWFDLREKTVMCFVCERQWRVGGGWWPEFLWRPRPSLTLPNLHKECPGCRIMIGKDGGCDHMHCTACGRHFSWAAGR